MAALRVIGDETGRRAALTRSKTVGDSVFAVSALKSLQKSVPIFRIQQTYLSSVVVSLLAPDPAFFSFGLLFRTRREPLTCVFVLTLLITSFNKWIGRKHSLTWAVFVGVVGLFDLSDTAIICERDLLAFRFDSLTDYKSTFLDTSSHADGAHAHRRSFNWRHKAKWF